MQPQRHVTFRSLSEKVGQFSLRDKIFLIPEMNRTSGHLLAGVFRSFGVNALVMETYKGLELGKAFTSGKECFPCQVTTGDILLFLENEQERLGRAFDAERYVLFMPEADGPCRFGMYNKYQRIVLDSFPELSKVKIGSLSSKNSYALNGMIEKERTRDFRKAAYFSVVVADILDRLLWRVRPYEREEGAADAFMERAMVSLADSFEEHGGCKDFGRILDDLEEISRGVKGLMDPEIRPKPKIGIVGEIYLRTHVHSNQNIIKVLERYGAEVVNASLAEWVDYTTYDRVRAAKAELNLGLRLLRFDKVKSCLKELCKHGADLLYQHYRQDSTYRRVRSLIDLAEDHRVEHLEKLLGKHDLYAFELGTEACLSIAGIMEYLRHGFNGIVNVYPFTCMPSTITSSIMRPIMNRHKIPYLDAAYDGTYQPGREAAIRTFMYQASQHFRRNGGKKGH
jgi:predicted nucleotide-binding protein (sugar kinase/HSP70/actin superfamily)